MTKHLFAALAWCAVALPAAAGVPGGDLTVVNARVYTSPDATPIEHATIVVRSGRIVALRAGDSGGGVRSGTLVDAHGGTVTAGFWNSHVHLLTPAVLHARERTADELAAEMEKMFTRWGFTTVFDVASLLTNTQVIRQRIDAGEVPGPRIFTVGDPFYPEHGTPIYVRKFLADNGIPSAEVASAAQATQRAQRQLAAGADGVKVFAGAIVGGEIGVLPMPLEIATAVVRAAHAAGKPAFAHPSDAAGVEVAIASGVDVLAHTAPMMGPWDAALVARLRDHHMALIPTLTLFDVELKKGGDSEEVRQHVQDLTIEQLKVFADGGGQVLFGTDIGYIDVYDTTEELQLMARALGWRQILASLTTNPAQRFTHGGGTLTVGAPADLVVLDGDPAQDVAALARVRYTIRDGRVLFPRAGHP